MCGSWVGKQNDVIATTVSVASSNSHSPILHYLTFKCETVLCQHTDVKLLSGGSRNTCTCHESSFLNEGNPPCQNNNIPRSFYVSL